ASTLNLRNIATARRNVGRRSWVSLMTPIFMHRTPSKDALIRRKRIGGPILTPYQVILQIMNSVNADASRGLAGWSVRINDDDYTVSILRDGRVYPSPGRRRGRKSGINPATLSNLRS